MYFRLGACKFQEGMYMDSLWADDFEEIPGDYLITNGNIKKYMHGERFTVFFDGKDVEVEPLNHDEFFYYYEIWEDFQLLNLLPDVEIPWMKDILKFFIKVYNEVETFRMKKK